MITRTSLLLVFLLKYFVMYFGLVAFVYKIKKILNKKEKRVKEKANRVETMKIYFSETMCKRKR